MERLWLAACGSRWRAIFSSMSYATIRAPGTEGAAPQTLYGGPSVAAFGRGPSVAARRHNTTDILQLLAGAAMAALAATSLVEAPVWPLLVLRVLVTELGHTLPLPAVALLAAGSGTPAGRAGSAL